MRSRRHSARDFAVDQLAGLLRVHFKSARAADAAKPAPSSVQGRDYLGEEEHSRSHKNEQQNPRKKAYTRSLKPLGMARCVLAANFGRAFTSGPDACRSPTLACGELMSDTRAAKVAPGVSMELSVRLCAWRCLELRLLLWPSLASKFVLVLAV